MAKTSQLGKTGRIGEQLAIKYLMDNGYEILDTNVTYKFGELDVVAKKDGVVYFIEVKAADLNSQMQVALSERVGKSKLQRIKKSVQQYVATNDLYQYELQIDVILIKVDAGTKKSKLKHIKGIY